MPNARPNSAAPTGPGNLLDRIPVLGVLVRAVQNYIRHQSGNQAGSVAFSFLLAMFPLLLLLSAAAAFIGHPGDAAALANRIIGYAPPVVQEALQPVVGQVLGQRREALVAVGLLITIWTASSGVQAIRTALNKAYGVEHGLSFWRARLKVVIFTLIVGMGTIVAFSSVVVMPYLSLLLTAAFGDGGDPLWLHTGIRYGSAFVVVAVIYCLLYGWLPDIPQQMRTVLPGALVGALLWTGAAAALSYALREAAKLAMVYGSFAGLVATLVFLYVSAVTLIFGAEINAMLRHRRGIGK